MFRQRLHLRGCKTSNQSQVRAKCLFSLGGLTAFAPDTASDDPGEAEQQPPQGIDPNLLDPIAPGPTLDTGLVDRITQSPELVNLLNQDPALAEALEQDPTYLYQIEQHLGLAEQWSNDDPSFTDPGLTEEQPPPDPSTPDEGLDDLTL
jgi:hypothetical protein